MSNNSVIEFKTLLQIFRYIFVALILMPWYQKTHITRRGTEKLSSQGAVLHANSQISSIYLEYRKLVIKMADAGEETMLAGGLEGMYLYWYFMDMEDVWYVYTISMFILCRFQCLIKGT